MNQIKSKLWNGRKVKKEKIFYYTDGFPFSAFYAAEEWIGKNGYSSGSMDGRGEPIAIRKGVYDLPQKWHNINKEWKQRADGVIISSNWREGEVKVILFEDKTVL